MKTIIEFFDPDAINNLTELLLFCPDNAVFIFDRETVSDDALDSLERACRMAIPGLRFSKEPADFKCMDSLLSTCRRVLNGQPGACVDLTGGGELAAVCAYRVCVELNVPLFQVDIRTKRVIPIHGPVPAPKNGRPALTLELLLTTRGASLGGYARALPDKEQSAAYEHFLPAVLADPQEWKSLCRYFQAGSTQYKSESLPLHFSAPRLLKTPDGQTLQPNMPLLQSAQQGGLIEHLRCQHDNISFEFLDATAKSYLTDYGIWLEFFCYRAFTREPEFSDVRMSVRVDWLGERKRPPEVLNEIDVTFMYGEHPVFISCKLSEPGVDALYELSMYARYLGGVTSKCILAVLADVSPEGHLAARAREMDILILSRRDILSGHFLDRVRDRL